MLGIGDRIKELRKKRKITAEELAIKIGKSRATIFRYENGDIEKVPYTILIPIAKALGTTPTYLLGMEDEPIENSFMVDLINLNLTEDEEIEILRYARYLVATR